MLDLKYIRDNLQKVIENTKNRNVKAEPERAASLYDERNHLLQQIESLRQKRKKNARAMKTKLPADKRQACIEEGKHLKSEISDLEGSLDRVQKDLNSEVKKIPNLTHPDAPTGKGEEDNREIKRWGDPKNFSFKPKDHLEIALNLDLIDFKTAARVSGQKHYYLKNKAVVLELALIRYAIDILTAEGFILTSTPDIARKDMSEGLGYNPRGDESDTYSLEGTETCLIATSEITLGAYYAGQILKPDELPVKLSGLSHCFRREAGAAGKYSKGLYRVHQFTKLEMFIFCRPDQSEEMHKYLLELEEKIYQGLNIPYRIVDTCTGELGGPAYRKYDIEAWMPGRGEKGEWGEITSASNCTDYQARRLGIRFKDNGNNIFVHMLNGTAIAVSRTLIAILENFQKHDGSVIIPEQLIPYTGFDHIIV